MILHIYLSCCGVTYSDMMIMMAMIPVVLVVTLGRIYHEYSDKMIAKAISVIVVIIIVIGGMYNLQSSCGYANEDHNQFTTHLKIEFEKDIYFKIVNSIKGMTRKDKIVINLKNLKGLDKCEQINEENIKENQWLYEEIKHIGRISSIDIMKRISPAIDSDTIYLYYLIEKKEIHWNELTDAITLVKQCKKEKLKKQILGYVSGYYPTGGTDLRYFAQVNTKGILYIIQQEKNDKQTGIEIDGKMNN